jgi:hypothetical protein
MDHHWTNLSQNGHFRCKKIFEYIIINFKHFRKYIFNNVLMNLSFMDFLFYVPFFCTAAAAVTEILNIYFVNVEFLSAKS